MDESMALNIKARLQQQIVKQQRDNTNLQSAYDKTKKDFEHKKDTLSQIEIKQYEKELERAEKNLKRGAEALTALQDELQRQNNSNQSTTGGLFSKKK